METYTSTPDYLLPNILCCLDGTIVVKAEVSPNEPIKKIKSINMDCHEILSKDGIHWCMIRYADPSAGAGGALASLVMGLFGHLRSCVLLDPPIHDYLQPVLSPASYDANLIDVMALLNLLPSNEPAEARGLLEALVSQKKKLNDSAGGPERG
jgi:hypothetical protein